jgi:hypothetical protein
LDFLFDGKEHSGFAGDKNEWHKYMPIRNQSSKIRQIPSPHSIIMVPVLLIATQICNIPQKQLDDQQQTIGEVLNKILVPRAGIVMFSVQIATSGVANHF